MLKEERKRRLRIFCFIISALVISFSLNRYSVLRHTGTLMLLAPFCVGLLAFFFQLFIDKGPLIVLYSKSYPYRKLKPYGWLSAFLIFEFVLVWGLYTKQILLLGEDLFLVTILFIGVVVYYHIFVRMKVSLRFVFLAIIVPLIAAGTALGLGSYLNILQFVMPGKRIGDIVFFNSLYWIFLSIFFQVVCEEPAFRGYLMQKLLYKGELFAIIISSACYCLWRVPFSLFIASDMKEVIVLLCGNFITGILFALIFVKSRNLLVAILCHGIISGLQMSFFASSVNPGIMQYMKFLVPTAKTQLLIIWFVCLLIGLIFLTFIPRKKLYIH
ncbi:MAG: type II CAAX endopeptidase family protein [Candidatus Orphnella occulta]|nr:type II CAAX endopeptidase family protein [Candidatus Orphnella occulta]